MVALLPNPAGPPVPGSPATTAAERVGLLERHLELCQQARLDHLGGTP